MKKLIIENGTRFGMLTVLSEAPSITSSKQLRRMFNCVCDCGNNITTWLTSLRGGTVTCCGCIRKKHGYSNTPTYKSWTNMRVRCGYTGSKATFPYKHITVYKEWLGNDGFSNFLLHMGDRPNNTSLDRIDNLGNYEPSNCRWASPSTQIQNRTVTKLNEVAVLVIKYMLLKGFSNNKLASVHNVAASTISLIKNNKTWTNVAWPTIDV